MLNDVGVIDLNLIISRAKIEKGMIVGDFGCGNGFFSRKIARVVSDTGIVYAVDVIKDVLENLQRLANMEGVNNIKTVWSDLEIYGATKIANNSLDASFIINTFFQSNKEQEFLDEVTRMMKVGGKIIIVDWQDDAVSVIAPNSKDRTGVEKLRKICKNLGNLKEVDLFQPGKNHYCMILEKIN